MAALALGNNAMSQAPPTILIADDQDDVREFATTVLAQAGYAVCQAADGTVALALIRDGEPSIDLLFTDIVMPGLSGFRLANKAKQLRPSLKVLYTTGYCDLGAIALADILDEHGKILRKPYRPAQLLAEVQLALTSRQAPLIYGGDEFTNFAPSLPARTNAGSSNGR
jgi:CheY-like chemotaxis protein